MTAIALRLTPELIAYPYPIGYDVINYYLPVITNFAPHWLVVSGQFPFYVLVLHFITMITNLEPDTVVRMVNIIIFGFFSIAIYQISRKVFRFQPHYSLFLSIFVMFQICVLRTAWDLHRDLLSLTALFFVISLVSSSKNLSKKSFIIVLVLCLISVLADRMVGLLSVSSLIIYATLRKNRMITLLTLCTSVAFLIVFLQGFSMIKSNMQLINNNTAGDNIYRPINLIILFVVINVFLIPTGVYGYFRTDEIYLKIPLCISLVGSFSWMVFPNTSGLLPDRWITIFGIFLSIFAAYGIVAIIEKRAMPKIVPGAMLAPFAIIGMLFALSPNDPALTTLSPYHEFIGQFTPMTMQYNSVSIPQSKSIINAIDWINHNTPIGSSVIIDKNWRGWTELELKQRSFNFYEKASIAKRGNSYALEFSGKSLPYYLHGITKLIYDNGDFSVYKLSLVR